MGGFREPYTNARVDCELKVPLISNGTTVATFEPTECQVLSTEGKDGFMQGLSGSRIWSSCVV